jgi:hypothetical protein
MSWTATITPVLRSRFGIDGKKQYKARWRNHGGPQVA